MGASTPVMPNIACGKGDACANALLSPLASSSLLRATQWYTTDDSERRIETSPLAAPTTFINPRPSSSVLPKIEAVE